MSDSISDLGYWAPHVTVAAICERSGEFLMVEEHLGGRDVITQPAGHVDEGESLVAAVEREVMEETGLPFKATAVVGIYRWISPKTGHTWLRFTFTGDITADREPLPRDKAILRASWMTEADIRANPDRIRSPQVLAGLDDYNNGRRLPLDLLRDLS